MGAPNWFGISLKQNSLTKLAQRLAAASIRRPARPPSRRAYSACACAAGDGGEQGSSEGPSRPNLQAPQTSRLLDTKRQKGEGTRRRACGARRTHAFAGIDHLLSRDGGAPRLARLAVGLAHNEADKLSRALLHQPLCVIGYFGVPDIGQLVGHDLGDARNRQLVRGNGQTRGTVNRRRHARQAGAGAAAPAAERPWSNRGDPSLAAACTGMVQRRAGAAACTAARACRWPRRRSIQGPQAGGPSCLFSPVCLQKAYPCCRRPRFSALHLSGRQKTHWISSLDNEYFSNNERCR